MKVPDVNKLGEVPNWGRSATALRTAATPQCPTASFAPDCDFQTAPARSVAVADVALVAMY